MSSTRPQRPRPYCGRGSVITATGRTRIVPGIYRPLGRTPDPKQFKMPQFRPLCVVAGAILLSATAATLRAKLSPVLRNTYEIPLAFCSEGGGSLPACLTGGVQIVADILSKPDRFGLTLADAECTITGSKGQRGLVGKRNRFVARFELVGVLTSLFSVADPPSQDGARLAPDEYFWSDGLSLVDESPWRAGVGGRKKRDAGDERPWNSWRVGLCGKAVRVTGRSSVSAARSFDSG